MQCIHECQYTSDTRVIQPWHAVSFTAFMENPPDFKYYFFCTFCVEFSCLSGVSNNVIILPVAQLPPSLLCNVPLSVWKHKAPLPDFIFVSQSQHHHHPPPIVGDVLRSFLFTDQSYYNMLFGE